MNKLTQERVLNAVSRNWSTLENPGFCLACGADADGVEPDAENYECVECGEYMVFGAEQVLLAGV